MTKHTIFSRNPKSGFTVVEMVIYGGILSIFIIVLSTMFSSILDMQLGAESTTAIVQDGRYLMSRFSYDVGRATAIVSPGAPGATSSVLALAIAGDTHTYTVVNGALTVANSSGTDALSSYGTTVAGFSVTQLGSVGGKNSVRISYTVTGVTELSGGVQSRDFVSTFALR